MDITTATPAQIDEQLADLDSRYEQLLRQKAERMDRLHQLDGQRKVYVGRRRVWSQSDDDTLYSLRRKVDFGEVAEWLAEEIEEALFDLAKVNRALDQNRAAAQPYEVEYERRPWSRFFTVAAGHIHSGQRCQGGSIRATTRLGWNPTLSGKTEAEAVAELGPLLCTHCFPSAPLEWTQGHKKADEGQCTAKKPVPGSFNPRAYMRYGVCSECGAEGVSITKTGNLRKHKRA